MLFYPYLPAGRLESPKWDFRQLQAFSALAAKAPSGVCLPDAGRG